MNTFPMTPGPASAGPRPVRPATLESVYAAAHWLLAHQRPTDAAKIFRLMLRVAPCDERAWLGLGECHERIDQLRVAAELYGAGSVIARGPEGVSVRCLLARARALGRLGRADDAEATLDLADRAAQECGDDLLQALVARQRRGA
jgi:tetratricopeptide (TPR) repeat protein